jgi:hypothetical protein
MTTKKKSDETSNTPNTRDNISIPAHEHRILLAQIAGTVAAGVTQAPSPETESADDVAEIAVEVAEAILARVGLHSR